MTESSNYSLMDPTYHLKISKITIQTRTSTQQSYHINKATYVTESADKLKSRNSIGNNITINQNMMIIYSVSSA